MMMSLDTEVESDSEENIKIKHEGDSPPPYEKGNSPAATYETGNSPTTHQPPDDEKQPIQNEKEAKPIGTSEQKPRNPVAGIVPQSTESRALPGLNINIPIIPMSVSSSI